MIKSRASRELDGWPFFIEWGGFNLYHNYIEIDYLNTSRDVEEKKYNQLLYLTGTAFL